MLRPVAGVCNVAEEQRRNNAQTNTEIRYCKWNKKCVALVLVRKFLLLQTRKIVNPFPLMVRNERTQPRIQSQVSILTVKGSSCQLYWLTIIIYIFAWISGSQLLNTRRWFYRRPWRLFNFRGPMAKRERLIEGGSLKEGSVSRELTVNSRISGPSIYRYV